MKKALWMLAGLLVISLCSYAQDAPHWELFGGAQYSRLDIHDTQNALNLLALETGTPAINVGTHLNGAGWNISLQENPNSWFGLVFDIGGAYAKQDVNVTSLLTSIPGNTKIIRNKPSFYTYTGGPQFTYRKNPRFQPFGRVLLGLAYTRASANLVIDGVPQLASDLTQSENAFDFTLGGGVDYHFSKHVAFRTSADYIRTYFSSLTQNNVRVSAGLTYRWTHSPVF